MNLCKTPLKTLLKNSVNVVMKVFVKLAPDAHIPVYKTEGASGADLFAYIEDELVIRPRERCLVSTGVAVQLPPGYELQVRPRSGLALKHGVTVLNAPGTVDSDYRGELQVLLVNLGDEDFHMQKGDRIAQAVISKVERVSFEEVSSLDKTARGSAGYGSTGK